MRTMLLVVAALLTIAPAGAACPMRWIVNAGSLNRSQAEFPLAQQRSHFDSPCTFLVIGKTAMRDYADWTAETTRSAPSLAGITEAAGDQRAKALLYDGEAWPMTPEEEQHNPVDAACRAAAIAHTAGKILIATPAIDLMRVVDPANNRGGRRYAAFEEAKIAAGIAACADVYEIQAQGAEQNTELYKHFVEAEAAQARNANPKIIVLAGLSTNPTGHRVTAEILFADVQAVKASVDGFWLNIPAGGKYCPNCGEPQPQVAAQLMQMLRP